MRRANKLSSFFLIAVVLALAVAGSLPHYHATAEDVHRCTLCLAHRTPALPAGNLPADVAALQLVSAVPLLQDVTHCACEISTHTTRAPPVSS